MGRAVCITVRLVSHIQLSICRAVKLPPVITRFQEANRALLFPYKSSRMTVLSRFINSQLTVFLRAVLSFSVAYLQQQHFGNATLQSKHVFT